VRSQEDLIGKVVASEYRKKILLALEKVSLTPSQIADATRLNRTHVSRFLKEMRSDGLVNCRACHLKKGKLHSITKLGKSVLKSVNELEKSRISV